MIHCDQTGFWLPLALVGTVEYIVLLCVWQNPSKKQSLTIWGTNSFCCPLSSQINGNCCLMEESLYLSSVQANSCSGQHVPINTVQHCLISPLTQLMLISSALSNRFLSFPYRASLNLASARAYLEAVGLGREKTYLDGWRRHWNSLRHASMRLESLLVDVGLQTSKSVEKVKWSPHIQLF